MLFVFDIYSKYVWVFPLKDKKVITITNRFQKHSDDFRHKPNTISLDQGSEFYNKLRFHKNSTELFSTYNKEKSVLTESFIRAYNLQAYECVSKKYALIGKKSLTNTIKHIIDS